MFWVLGANKNCDAKDIQLSFIQWDLDNLLKYESNKHRNHILVIKAKMT